VAAVGLSAFVKKEGAEFTDGFVIFNQYGLEVASISKLDSIIIPGACDKMKY